MSAPAVTALLLERVGGLGWAGLSDSTRAATVRHLLDTLAAIIAGSDQRVTVGAEAALAGVRAAGAVPVPGRERRQDLLDAVWLAAVAGHGLELDDGYRPGSTHPGTVVIPAVLALAHQSHASGEALLEAVVAGYEAVTLVARLAHPRMRRRGFHPTATSGVFGAAVAAARLRGLDQQALERALGLAASGAAGLFAFVAGGADVKRLHPGHAAREGVLAVLLAEQGLAGPPRVLEGRDGFFQAFADGLPEPIDWQAERARAPGISDCYIKPYPCCRHLQPAIDAVLALAGEHDLHAEEVSAIEVETYRIAADHATVGWTDFASSQLSFPFVLATALRHRAVTLAHFNAAARADAATAALCARVSVRASDDMDRRYLDQRPARVRLHARGRVYEHDASEALGSATVPMDEAALEKKFIDLSAPIVGADRARALRQQWSRVERVHDVAPLIDATAPPFDLTGVP
ncbi:hypothetical protein CEK62_15065 [Alcanivorax sp. N3-2A]|nr:hypothetical protein CEK62_15065 [Alcanivorax sp. N3-2A]|tara:strand:- start:9154 stop:10539 length:1386 start_codon:yes stop_codon:yes gene_type:complete